MEKKKAKADKWAIEKCNINALGIASVAREATDLFKFPVVPDTLRRYIRIGATTVSKMDAPSKLPEKEYNAISNALLYQTDEWQA